MIKVGMVWYPNTPEGRQAARDAFKWRREAAITEIRKMRTYGPSNNNGRAGARKEKRGDMQERS